jgi:hypothetical protein
MVKETDSTFNLEQIIADILATIDKEREREIVARRYGLYERRETLEQIGELLGITRERVRQLEKATVTKMKQSADELPNIELVEAVFRSELAKTGNTARILKLAKMIAASEDKITQARLCFLAEMTPGVVFIDENDHYFTAASVAPKQTEKSLKKYLEEIISTIKKIGKPITTLRRICCLSK